jgi:hypothetical protein
LATDENDDLRAFLRDNVSSFEELETLLFFARAPRRRWKVRDVSVSLRLTDELTRDALNALPGTLIARDSSGTETTYFYAPARDLELLVERLRSAYEEQRLAVVQIMTANAMERMRSSAARRLADAFRLDRSKK